MKFSGLYCCLLIVALCRSSFQADPVCTTITATDYTKYIYSHEEYGSDNYPSARDVCWNIYAQDQTKIIQITKPDENLFQIQYGTSDCLYDKLQIEDLSIANGRTIKFCGSNIFSVLYSSGPGVQIRFTSDESTTCYGFRLGLIQTVASASHFSLVRWNSNYYFYGYSTRGCTDYVSTPISTTLGISAGITLGIVAFVLVIVIIIIIVYYKHKQNKILTVDIGPETGPRIHGKPRGEYSS